MDHFGWNLVHFCWLVVWLPFFDFSHILGIIIPSGHHFPQVNQKLVGGLEHEFYFPINIGFRLSSQLTNSYFSEGWPNHQPGTVCHWILHPKQDIGCAFPIRWVSGAKCCLTSWVPRRVNRERRVFVLGMPRELVVWARGNVLFHVRTCFLWDIKA